MHGSSRPRNSNDQNHLIATLNTAIEGFNLAKGVMNIALAKAAFGSVSIILTAIRDSRFNEEDYIKLGIDCAGVCIALSRGMNGRSLVDTNPSFLEAIAQLTTTVAEIQEAILKKRKRWKMLKLIHVKIDTQTINTWRSDLSRILILFDAELAPNTHNTVTGVANDVRGMKDPANVRLTPAQAPEPGELPPPPPRACIGRDTLIEELACRAEKLEPSALIGAGGTGKTTMALAVLHHERIVRKFLDKRGFIRCNEFPASIVNFLDRLSTVIGAGIKNVTSLTPLQSFITAQAMILVLDNAETILDPHLQDAQAIYLVIEELSRSPNLCLIITSRLSTVPSGCEHIDVPSLSKDAAQEIIYRIYPDGERSNLVDGLLERLDFHPLSIMILATVASQKLWDYHRILKEWERQKVKVLQTGHRSQNLAATIEVSLDSPTFRELGPQAREVLGVVAFFSQGIDEEKLDWLFPDISDRGNIIDTLCTLSLASSYRGFVTMLAPLREYLHPKDLSSPSLLWEVKERYFSRLHLVDEGLQPGMPEFEETEWILRENYNVEHLLEAFVSLDEGSEDVWEAYADFLLHLSWHKPTLVVPEMVNSESFGGPKKQEEFFGSFGKRMLQSFSDHLLGQKVINRFDKVLSNGIISGEGLSRCLQVLCRMCEHQNAIPESMRITTADNSSSTLVYSGGFACVYRGEHNGNPVAIKAIRVYPRSNLEVIASGFCREAVLWKHLQHPNISRFSMVSEWMYHGDINEYIGKHEGVNRVRLLFDATNGLKYMHSLGVVHGDLKGANILINKGFRACLTDFGHSTSVVGVEYCVADNVSLISVASRGSLVSFTGGGTTQWMSPELIYPETFGDTDCRPTKQSDYYALGMVVYEVLCGKYPWQSNNETKVMLWVVEGKRPQRPEEAESPGFTDELWRMVECCWRQNRNERPEVGEILRCLETAARAWDTRPPRCVTVRTDSEDSENQ